MEPLGSFTNDSKINGQEGHFLLLEVLTTVNSW